MNNFWRFLINTLLCKDKGAVISLIFLTFNLQNSVNPSRYQILSWSKKNMSLVLYMPIMPYISWDIHD